MNESNSKTVESSSQTSNTFPTGVTPSLGLYKKSQPVIEIFIEDEGKLSKKMWSNYLRKIIPAGFEPSFYSKKGRNNVIKEFENDYHDDGRRKIFIIDADMDILKGNPSYVSKYFYRLQAYCVENYLFEEQNIVSLCNQLRAKVKVNDHELHFDFSSWKKQNRLLFKRLYVWFALVQMLRAEITNVGIDINSLCMPSPNKDLLCPIKIKEKIREIYNALISNGYSKKMIFKYYKKVKNNANKNCFLNYVSGKTHLFSLIDKRLQKKYYITIRPSNIIEKLSENISPDVDNYLRLKIKRLCK